MRPVISDRRTLRPVRLSRRHPTYEKTREAVRLSEASYEGGEAFRSLELLDAHPRETRADYTARLERAYYSNFVAVVVDTYVAEVFRRAPSREVDGEAFEQFTLDATLAGEPLTDLMQDVLTRALVAGTAYVCVDLEDETRRPYLHQVHPENVLDYSMDKNGSYNWAMIAELVTTDDEPEIDRKEERRVRLWRRDSWTLYDAQGGVIAADENSSGVIPLIRVDGRATRLPTDDIVETNRRLYNIDSQRDEILVRLTFPQLYVEAVVPKDSNGNNIDAEEMAIEIGTNRVMVLPPGTGTAPGYLAPPDGPVEQHRKERELLRAQIFELAGLERQSPDAQTVQSGVAKAYDFRETNARLANSAALCQSVERRVFDILTLFGVSGSANPTYIKDFDVQAFEAQLESYLRVAEAPLPASVKRMAARDLAGRIAEERTDSERKEADDDVRAMTPADFGDARQSSILDALGSNFE